MVSTCLRFARVSVIARINTFSDYYVTYKWNMKFYFLFRRVGTHVTSITPLVEVY